MCVVFINESAKNLVSTKMAAFGLLTSYRQVAFVSSRNDNTDYKSNCNEPLIMLQTTKDKSANHPNSSQGSGFHGFRKPPSILSMQYLNNAKF